jgi:hypothetical protein
MKDLNPTGAVNTRPRNHYFFCSARKATVNMPAATTEKIRLAHFMAQMLELADDPQAARSMQ